MAGTRRMKDLLTGPSLPLRPAALVTGIMDR